MIWKQLVIAENKSLAAFSYLICKSICRILIAQVTNWSNWTCLKFHQVYYFSHPFGHTFWIKVRDQSSWDRPYCPFFLKTWFRVGNLNLVDSTPITQRREKEGICMEKTEAIEGGKFEAATLEKRSFQLQLVLSPAFRFFCSSSWCSINILWLSF